MLQAKESVKSEVADVVLELHDHFDEKTRLLVEDKKKASQEECSQEIENAKGTADQIIAEAEEKAGLLEEEAKEKVSQIQDRIAYYNHQLEEISEVISQIMSSVQ